MPLCKTPRSALCLEFRRDQRDRHRTARCSPGFGPNSGGSFTTIPAVFKYFKQVGAACWIVFRSIGIFPAPGGGRRGLSGPDAGRSGGGILGTTVNGMGAMSFSRRYCEQTAEIARSLPGDRLEALVDALAAVRAGGGRLFFLGVGGGAGHASHAVCDFRKLAGFECYTPTDNVSELTARINDDGWETSYARWLEGSRIGPRDAVFVFSVGGGNADQGGSQIGRAH